MYIVLEEQNDGSYLSLPDYSADSLKELSKLVNGTLAHGTYPVAKMVSPMTVRPKKVASTDVVEFATLNPRKQNGAE